MIEVGTILCAVNLTENTEDIALYTSQIAKLNKAKVVLFHSLPRVDNVFDLANIHGGVEALRESTKKRANDFLDTFVSDNFDGVEVVRILSEKHITQCVLELVEEHCADLIIVGSFSSKSFAHIFVSNNSQNIIGKTRIPVLVVPNDLNLECTLDE